METSQLSNNQLFEIIQNEQLDNNIRELAKQEYTARQISPDEVRKFIAKQDAKFAPKKELGLKPIYKFLLILFPFFIEIHGLIAGRFLAKGFKITWKEYWIYLCIGYLLWTAMIIAFAKYYLFKPIA